MVMTRSQEHALSTSGKEEAAEPLLPQSIDDSTDKLSLTITTPQDSSLFPTLGVTTWLGWNGALFYLVVYLVAFASNTQRLCIISTLYLTTLFPPSALKSSLGKVVATFILKQATKYFGLKLTFVDVPHLIKHSNNRQPVIFAFEPHDILPYGVFAFSPVFNKFPKEFSWLVDNLYGLMTGIVFKIPLMRNIYSWTGMDSVDKKTFQSKLRNGHSVVFCPGGVQEVIFVDSNDDDNRVNSSDDVVLFLKSRKGFIKLALEAGAPIVPVFCFHLDGSFNYWIPKHPIISTMARKIGYLPLIFFGKFKILLGIPHPRPLHVIVGKPIDVPRMGEAVSPEMVEKYHELYLKSTEELFENYKHAEGYGHRKLRII